MSDGKRALAATSTTNAAVLAVAEATAEAVRKVGQAIQQAGGMAGGRPIEIVVAPTDTTPDTTIRQATPADAATLAEFAERVFDEELANYLADNLQAWRLKPDGGYERVSPAEGEMPYSAQGALLARLCG